MDFKYPTFLLKSKQAPPLIQICSEGKGDDHLYNRPAHVKLEYLENQSRRNNIRVSGIPESPDETWEVAEAKVKQAIQEQLGVDVDIERAHRVERRNRDRSSQDTQQRKPRTIVCKLRCWKQREAVLKKARKSKPSGLFISEDLVLATLQRRAAQVGKLREAKQAGKIAYFVLDRLVIRDKKIPSTV